MELLKLINSVSDDDRFDRGAAPFFTDVELARRWGISPKTLRNARVAGSGIAFVRIGRLVRYPRAAVIEYERRQLRHSTSE